MMDWPNERYVRLYTRMTSEMRAWRWEAQAIWPWLLAIADDSGIIAARAGPRRVQMLAGNWSFPVEVVEAGMAELLEDGCVVESDSGFAIPNFIDAQEPLTSEAAQ